MSSASTQLEQIFNDPSYAWELLECEMAIEMNDALSGQAIAHLLELYMRGVEKMNSLMDIRQSYFKNKVTSLMMKNTVVKTLNKPPMAKKQKPLQTTAKSSSKTSSKTNGDHKNSKKKEKTVTIQDTPAASPVNTFALQEKRRELEMRLAYEAETSSRENLNNLYNQHLKKEQSYKNKVKGLINDHEEQLKDRINRRKLKTATYRSPPHDTSDTFNIEEEENNHIRKTEDQPFSPRQHNNRQETRQRVKRYHSVGHKPKIEQSQSNSRPRKNTHDFTTKIDPEKKEKEIDVLRKTIQDIKTKKKGPDNIELIIVEDIKLSNGQSSDLEHQKQYRQSV